MGWRGNGDELGFGLVRPEPDLSKCSQGEENGAHVAQARESNWLRPSTFEQEDLKESKRGSRERTKTAAGDGRNEPNAVVLLRSDVTARRLVSARHGVADRPLKRTGASRRQ